MGGAAGSRGLFVDLDALTTAFPLADVEQILEQTDRMSKRRRKLPAPMLVYYIIALGLMVSVGAREVLRRFLEKIREDEDWPRVDAPIASEAAITKARKRLGVEPVRRLFEQAAKPIALETTRGAWFAGRRVVSLDGSTLHVQDSDANERAFGRLPTSKSPAAWPLIRFVLLIENGTRVPFGAAMSGCRTSENALARQILGRLERGMICLADRLYYSYDMWTQALTTGADLLWRVPGYIRLPRLQTLDDRSYLSELRPARRGPKHRSGPAIPVRVMEFTARVRGKTEHYRVITTIMDPHTASAIELARLYAERWCIETALREIKTHLRGRRTLLRSKLPELVRQDFYGLLLAYFGVRCLMHEGALNENIEPISISFLHALNVVIRALPEIISFSPSGEAALP